jgi:hypothetical protein
MYTMYLVRLWSIAHLRACCRYIDYGVATKNRVFSYYAPNSSIKHNKSDSKDRSQAGIIRLTYFSTTIHVSGLYIQPESTQNTQDPKSGYTPDPDLVQQSG